MSKVLSVYNKWAFCELVLSAVMDSDYTYLLDTAFFRLTKNCVINFECVHGVWSFCAKQQSGTISPINQTNRTPDVLPKYGRYIFETTEQEKLVLIVEEKENPLYVYEKYLFSAGQKLTIGSQSGNTIRYDFPKESNVDNFVSHQHCCIDFLTDGAVLSDCSLNGTYINGVRAEKQQYLSFGDSIRIFGLNIIYLGNVLAINSEGTADASLQPINKNDFSKLYSPAFENGSSAKTMFYRAPRSVPKIITEPITIDPPPAPKEMPNTPVFMQIGPALTMALPMLLGSGMTIVASRLSGGANSAMMATGIITAGASAVIGAFWAIMNLRQNKKNIVESEQKRFTKYGEYLSRKQKYIEEIYYANSAAFCERYPSASDIAGYDASNEKLWNRNFNHSDMLHYRLGIGDAPLPVTIEVQKEKFSMLDDSLADKARMIRDSFSVMHNVPICIDVKENSLTGVLGRNGQWAQIIKNIIVQIAGNNSYTDVKIALVYDESKISSPKSWTFMKWLPHVWSQDHKMRFLATNAKEAGEVFYAIGQMMRVRSEENSSKRPHVVLIVLNKELLEGELISKYISDTSDSIGLSTVIAAEEYESLPNNCEYIIENNTDFCGMYSTISEFADKIPISFDYCSDDQLMRFAKTLGNIEITESESGGEIPTSISFLDMYGVSKIPEFHSEERWRKAKTAETMKAMIGLKTGGKPCYLDIHERYHGPHGLVAGTTGSGKSETLQTYMLSLAINYSPDDVAFFIIDYKGGGMANLFDGLPHMIGTISNLSGNQVKRAMVSIKSENKRRQRIFSNFGVNNINAYTSLYKNGDAKEPIPHLFIIIDEFAELKREEPDFMRELVSVAQVGRSLGVHLILSTQKPAGTVDENIWSNSKFRLCLRVQDRQDSMDMLHRPDAAYLTQAGRGFLQVGNDEVFELFQSGYSGAIYDESNANQHLTVAQILDNVGLVDLAGNHYKIQYQQQIKRKWVTQLCNAAHWSVEECCAASQSEADVSDSDCVELIYQYLENEKIPFKKSSYNDVRLKEFLHLYQLVAQKDLEEQVVFLIEQAEGGKLRLPELKGKTQLSAINEYLAKISEENGYTHKISLWMPVLPEHIVLNQLDGFVEYNGLPAKREAEEWSLSVVVGKGDDPENQNQMSISVDFGNNGHHVICGTVSTGKSIFVQSTIYALINKYTSDDVNIYILDFSAKLQNVFEDSCHVGGYISDAEEDLEKTSKFFMMMSNIIEERKKLLASSNYRDYVEHSGKQLPAIVIAIDNYAGFREKTEDAYEDVVKSIAKEGLNFGIYLLVSAGGFGTSELPTRMAENFRTTICLEMPDVYQYSDVMRVVRVPIYPESNVKGRGLVVYGEKIIEFQTALPCEGESSFERNAAIRKQILRINSESTAKPARKIPVIPEKPTWELYTQDEQYKKLCDTPDLLPCGYDSETASYAAIDLTSLHTYLVSGAKKSGKTTFMKNLIQACADKKFDVAVIEFGSDEYKNVAAVSGAQYISTPEEAYDYAKNVLLYEAGVRAERKKQCIAEHLENEEFFKAMSGYQAKCIFIANAHQFQAELYNRESEAYKAVKVFETLAGDRGEHYNFFFFMEGGDQEIQDEMGFTFASCFKDNAKGIRFGGKFLAQRIFSFANLPYKMQGNAMKPGIGVIPTDIETARIEQIVVPYYKG